VAATSRSITAIESPVQVFGLGLHVGPVVRGEDRVDDVRRAGFVDRHQALAQHAEGAAELVTHFFEVLLFLLQGRRRPFQLALLFGQFGLDRRLLLPQSRDFADHRVDCGVLFGDRFRQRALVGVDVVELALGCLQLFLRGLRRRARLGQRQGADRRQQQPREEQRAPLGCARMSVEEESPHRDPRRSGKVRQRVAQASEDA
jgi:hypothetical protein